MQKKAQSQLLTRLDHAMLAVQNDGSTGRAAAARFTVLKSTFFDFGSRKLEAVKGHPTALTEEEEQAIVNT